MPLPSTTAASNTYIVEEPRRGWKSGQVDKLKAFGIGPKPDSTNSDIIIDTIHITEEIFYKIT
jgi:hypothetical protein